MAENKQVNMPGMFGGLMRYDDEYKSRFVLSPTQVIIFIIAIILLVLILKAFWPAPIASTLTLLKSLSQIFSNLI